MNCKKCTERPGHLSQRIKNCTQEVICTVMFQRKRVEEDLLDVKIVRGVRFVTRQLVKRRNYQIMANEKGRCDSQAETLGPIAKKFQKSYLLSY